jgi:hypothetical protein
MQLKRKIFNTVFKSDVNYAAEKPLLLIPDFAVNEIIT